MEYSSEGIVAGIFAGIPTIIGGLYWLRKKIRDDKLDSKGAESAENGLKISDKVLANMQTELDRLAKRVDVLEKQVAHLTEKLANVRLIALDCYQLATECECANENRQRLLEHLKSIIKES